MALPMVPVAPTIRMRMGVDLVRESSAAKAETSAGGPNERLACQRHCFPADSCVAMNAADFPTAVSASGVKSAWNTCHMPS